MGTTVLEVLLLAWIMLALAVMVVMGVRRSRRNRSDPNSILSPLHDVLWTAPAIAARAVFCIALMEPVVAAALTCAPERV